MIAVLLAGLVTFSIPEIPPGVTIDRPIRVEVAQWRQSRFWVCCSGVMLSIEDAWRVGWPRVRREAALEYRVIRTLWGSPGRDLTTELPTGSYRWRFCDERSGACSEWSRFFGVQ